MTLVNESTNYGGETARLVCPRCKSEIIWKDGKRIVKTGSVQRYVCTSCESRFSGERIIKDLEPNKIRRVCDIEIESKNLIVASKNWATGDNENGSGIIIEYVKCLERIPLTDARAL